MGADEQWTNPLRELLSQHLPVVLIGHGKQVVYVLQVVGALVPPRLVEPATDRVDHAHGVGITVHDYVWRDAEEGAC